jgi:hypothetical protein
MGTDAISPSSFFLRFLSLALIYFLSISSHRFFYLSIAWLSTTLAAEVDRSYCVRAIAVGALSLWTSQVASADGASGAELSKDPIYLRGDALAI